ncbi:MAG: glycosyltransferase [Sporolactobacillus sp.]
MFKKIGCVVVTYNRKELLAEAVSSILQQSYPVSRIIIIDNHSTDGTEVYLKEKKLITNKVEYIRLDKNLGGSAGFYYGLKKAITTDVEWISLSDDDAILKNDYFENIVVQVQEYPKVKAFTGTVVTNNKIQYFHRRFITSSYTLKHRVSSEIDYKGKTFFLDSFSFVGCLIHKDIIQKVGLPEIGYFTQLDDTEYSLRIRHETNILNVNNAIIDHKTKILDQQSYKPDWKEFYSIRNQCFMILKHSKNKIFARIYFPLLILKKMMESLTSGKYDKYRKYRIGLLKDVYLSVFREQQGVNEKYLP